MIIQTNNEDETKSAAYELVDYLKPGMVLLLEGNLGTGKTTFTKGLARGLEIDALIKSPTYTIVREYQKGRYPLFHIDLYRLSEEGVEELFLDDYFEGEGISVVEWSSVAPDFLPNHYLRIDFKALDETKRQIKFSAQGSEYEALLKEFKEHLSNEFL